MDKDFSFYQIFDHPELLSFLFHPRKNPAAQHFAKNLVSIEIPVDKDVIIGAQYFSTVHQSPNILFFHGNGEIVDDYLDIGSMFVRMGINFLPVDYRGYGHSTGYPTVESMMKDCHAIFHFVREWLMEKKRTGSLIIMGRSLGSACALELVSSYPEEIDGLIIESGFAHTVPLLQLLGVNTNALGIDEDAGFGNIDKIRKFEGPTLVIHAEKDHIIPFHDGRTLYNASLSTDKAFLAVPEANHNTIFVYGIEAYMKAVKTLADKTMK